MHCTQCSEDNFSLFTILMHEGLHVFLQILLKIDVEGYHKRGYRDSHLDFLYK